ncbi:MAG: SMP-30/gluconolactonase/LRE family protein [Gammaproteobacteria bacterium]|nr:SMP-30/gluconolactonase/LRE family protein [Gammaproteobacteria bacterium]
MDIVVEDSRFLDVVDENLERETLSEEFQFTEGPIWHPTERHVTFSDIPANRMYRWSEADGLSVYREPSNMANGNTYDHDGRILSCEHATSRVVREVDGGLQVLASHFDGKELNSPNDIIVGDNGEILFTDPLYGRQGHTGVVREPELDFQGVFKLDPASLELTLLASDFDSPNGLCFGLDQDTLFVADTKRRHIRRFHIGDGALEGGEVFADSPAPDGLKIDSRGYLYAGGPGGVHVYHPDDGAFLGVIPTGAFCANFTWGDDDMMTLFMTSATGFYRTRVKIPGIPLF